MSLAYDRSTRAYEREADETRRRLSGSLDELASNLTPGRMLDEVLTYARAGGADFLRGLGNAASANPMPTLLIGIGAAMFLTGKGRVDGGNGNGSEAHGASVLRHTANAMRRQNDGDMARSERGAASAAATVAGAVGSAASRAAAAVGSAATGAADAVGGATSSAADAVGSTVAHAADRVRSGAAAVGSAATGAARTLRDGAAAGVAAAEDVASTASEFVSTAAEAVAEGARAAAGSVSQFGATARETAAEGSQHLFDQTARLTRDLAARTNRLIQEQPLAVAAAGLAIGAALAAALPRTRTEDALLGETSDAVKDTVAGAAGEQLHRAKEATGRVVEEVKTVAQKEGLSTLAAADAIRDVGEKVKHVVSAAGAASMSPKSKERTF